MSFLLYAILLGRRLKHYIGKSNYNSVPILKYLYGQYKFYYVVSWTVVNCSKNDDIVHDLAYKSRQNRIDLFCTFSSFFSVFYRKGKTMTSWILVWFYSPSIKIN